MATRRSLLTKENDNTLPGTDPKTEDSKVKKKKIERKEEREKRKFEGEGRGGAAKKKRIEKKFRGRQKRKIHESNRSETGKVREKSDGWGKLPLKIHTILQYIHTAAVSVGSDWLNRVKIGWDLGDKVTG